MLATELIRAVEQAGGHLEPDGDGLVVEAPGPLPEPIMTELRARKAEVLIALAGQAAGPSSENDNLLRRSHRPEGRSGAESPYPVRGILPPSPLCRVRKSPLGPPYAGRPFFKGGRRSDLPPGCSPEPCSLSEPAHDSGTPRPQAHADRPPGAHGGRDHRGGAVTCRRGSGIVSIVGASLGTRQGFRHN